MTKIYCADISCKWYKDGSCTAKKVSLAWHHVHTIHDGIRQYNKCKTYEDSDDCKEMRQKIERFMEGRK